MNHERYTIHSTHGVFRVFDTETAEYLIGLHESRYDALRRIGRMTGNTVWRVVTTCPLAEAHGPHTSVVLGVGTFPCPEVHHEGFSDREAFTAEGETFDAGHAVDTYADDALFSMRTPARQ